MPSPDAVARAHHDSLAGLSNSAAAAARGLWQRVNPNDLDGTWPALAARVLVIIAGAQLAAAQQSDTYVDDALAAQNVTAAAEGSVAAAALAGVASDGRSLESLLRSPVAATKLSLGSGVAQPQAMASGLATLEMIAATQVSDAGRVADGVAMTVRPTVTKYVRMLSPPSCSRCAILAGAEYEWNAGFDRHPRCDCVGLPSVESRADDVRVNPKRYFDSLSQAEQDRIFTKSGAQAIRDGADIGRVVNARRGMSTTVGPSGRRTLAPDSQGRLTTTELRTHRPGGVRLMPEQIYLEARRLGWTRTEVIRQLRRFGYIT